MKKIAYLFFLFVLLATAATARETPQASPDSILKSYRGRAAAYSNRIVKDSTAADSLFAVLDQMETLARTVGNKPLQAMALNNRLSAMNKIRQYDQIIDEAPGILARVEKLEQWRFYFMIYETLVDAYRRRGNLDKALESAAEMYRVANELRNPAAMGVALLAMSRVYNVQRLLDRQEECLRRAIPLMQDSTYYLNTLAAVYYNLGSSLMAQKKFDEALQVAIGSEDINRRYEAASGRSQMSAWNNTYLLYIDIYRRSDNYDMAEVYLHKFDSLTAGARPMYLERGHILYGKRRYREALEMFDKQLGQKPEDLNALDLKLATLLHLSAPNDSTAQRIYHLHCQIVDHVDTLHLHRHAAELDELRTRYEVDRHIAEKARNRNKYLFVLALSILLVVLLGVAMYYNRVMREKNRRLYNQIKAADAAAAIAPLPRHAGYSPLAGGDGEENAGDKELVARLRDYLLTDDNLTRDDITRDDIIAALGTNRNLLSEAVKAVTGYTLMEYIRTLQLEEARRIIDSDPELTIDAIASACGFTSNTFYRLFRKHYGMTPTEYRKLGREK